jgi:hypothetical protein
MKLTDGLSLSVRFLTQRPSFGPCCAGHRVRDVAVALSREIGRSPVHATALRMR